MNKYEYFKYAVKEKFIYKLDWLYSFFTIHDIEFKGNDYLRIINNRYEVKIDNVWNIIDSDIENPVYNMLEEIEITKDMIVTIDNKLITTMGRFLANKILLEYNFGNKIKYINSSFNIGKIEKGILVLVSFVYQEKYYEGMFFYTDEQILLNVDDEFEKAIGSKIEQHKDYKEILRYLLRNVVPWSEMITRIDELDLSIFEPKTSETVYLAGDVDSDDITFGGTQSL